MADSLIQTAGFGTVSRRAGDLVESHPRATPGALAAAPELQRLWLTLSQRPWRSLVVMPSGVEGSAFDLAQALVEIGNLLGTEPVRLLDAEELALPAAVGIRAELRDAIGQGRVIVCARPATESPAAFALAQGADAVLLTIELGVADFASAERVVELVGRERIVGCVTQVQDER